jgi:hypothetical protein
MNEKTTELIQQLEKLNEKPRTYFSFDLERKEIVVELFHAYSKDNIDPALLVKNLKDKMDVRDFVYFAAEKCSEKQEQKQLFLAILDGLEKEYKISLKDVLAIHPLNMIIEKQSKEAIEKVFPEKFIMSRDPNGRNPFLTALSTGDREVVELVTSRMQTSEELSGNHFYTYNYGNQFETILAFEGLAKKGDTNMMEFMIEKGFDLKSKQSLEMIFARDFMGNREMNITNFPLESSKLIISRLGHTNSKDISEFTKKDVDSWASLTQMRLTYEVSNKNNSQYKY